MSKRWWTMDWWIGLAIRCYVYAKHSMRRSRYEMKMMFRHPHSNQFAALDVCHVTPRHVVGGKLFNESRYNSLMDIFHLRRNLPVSATREQLVIDLSRRGLLLISQPWIISNKTWLRSIKGESFETWKSIFPLPRSSPFGVFQALVKVAQFTRKYRSLS